ncbi:MAG: RagB/SusD family nutrient uptake outer membrane protein [Bacteroidales bacterium]|nr:RagB/SusD family nutrient uptake outer membrane protein [Bacteroidales bacterium]HRW20805.1 RagB/SusD family nutrient uptake outer membrane protein [Bacteroidales bacterium]
MKKILYYLSFVLSISSCVNLDDNLEDKIPYDKFPENENQSALMIGSVYTPMKDFLDNGGWWFCQELTSDEVVCPTRHTDWDDGGKWRVLYQHTWDNNTEAINNMWSRFYSGVGQANYWIEFFAPTAETEAGATTIAKLKIMRAYYYYLLIDNYGDVPYVTQYAGADQQPQKTARAVIFQNIVNEINESIPYLTSSTSKTAVTKGMAYSLLAKLYLNAKVYAGVTRWDSAGFACDSVIALNQYSLEADPLAPFVTDNSASSENIFTIPYDEDTYTGFNLHMRTLHYNSNLTFDMTVGPWNGFAITEQHYNTYASNDKRKDGYFLVGQQYTSSGQPITDAVADAPLVFDPYIPALVMDASYTPEEIRMSGVRVKKFEIKLGAKENLSNDFPIFRYADILLMKAEAMVRQGYNGDEWINPIRERAGLDDITDATLDDILAERGRELFWEAHRRQDLIRFDKFNKAWWEKTADDASRRTFPIPQWVIDTNPNLAK